MVPVRKDDKDPMVQKSKDINNTKEELHTKNKKWWHFGRILCYGKILANAL